MALPDNLDAPGDVDNKCVPCASFRVSGPASTARDRLEAHNDYEINRKAEEEVRAVLEHLSAQDEALARIVETLVSRTKGMTQG